ncbi:MAG: GGDEF domain-containing protein [Desulfobacteraceae bacterium]|nr:MAG: GGDEF domain-containing protein [Desulfobacteraceae bacterium]
MKLQKNRLILIVSLLLVTGFLMTSLVSFFVSRASLRSQISEKELPLTGDNIYSEIQRDLLSPIFISSLMSTDTFLRDWVIRGEKDASKITRYLSEIKKKYKTYTSFFVSEITGNYYYADGILKKISPDEERDKWYFRVRDMKPDYEINIDPDMANRDTMTIFINYRVFDYEGEYIGATGVGLAVGAVKRLIETYQQKYNRRIYFTDKEGNIKLYGSDFPVNIKNIAEIPGMQPDVMKKLSSLQEISFKYVNDGKTILLHSRYIPEFGWYLFVEQTEEAAIRQILYTLFINLSVSAVITIIILLFTNMTISAYQDKLEGMASTDPLTGAYNRRAFDIILKQTLKDAIRNKTDISLILFDIDKFKETNDRFGHNAGDAVLGNIIKITGSCLRASDVICRWGGEEFLILLKQCNINEAFNIAEKIRMTVGKTPAFHGGREIYVTISLGVVQSQYMESEENIFSRVDMALYEAKKQGRNRSIPAPSFRE